MKKTMTLLSGAVVALLSGAVSAEGPLTLTVQQMDQVTAGRGFTSFTDVAKTLSIQELIQEQKQGFFQVITEVSGFSAVAEAEADSEHPFGADAQTFTFAEVFPVITPVGPDGATALFFKTTSLSKSIALGGGLPVVTAP